MATSLLIDDNPLQVLPRLAEKIGLNEAIVLQQLHYWLNRSENYRDGVKWVFNSYPDWKKQFPFWSIPTIQRTFARLENLGLVKAGKFNKMKGDLTKWYTIDYTGIEALENSCLISEKASYQNDITPSYQNDTKVISKWHDASYQNDTAITRDYVPEITSEINSVVVASPPPDKKQAATTTTRPEKSEAVLIEEYFLLATTGSTGFMSAKQREICKELEKQGMTAERARPGIDHTIADMNGKGLSVGSISLCVAAIHQFDPAKAKPTPITAYQNKPKPFEQQKKPWDAEAYRAEMMPTASQIAYRDKKRAENEYYERMDRLAREQDAAAKQQQQQLTRLQA